MLRYTLSFLGGGLVAAVGNWFFAARNQRRQAELDRLQQQLDRLYGPLYFFTSQNEQLFKLYDDIHNAYSTYFNRPWSTEDATQEALKEQGKATIDLGNEYVARVVENNHHVMGILRDNWHLVDADDVKIFSQFQVDYTRFQKEVEEEHARQVPWGVMRALDNVSYMRPAFIDGVEAAVTAKRERIDVLTLPKKTRRKKKLRAG